MREYNKADFKGLKYKLFENEVGKSHVGMFEVYAKHPVLKKYLEFKALGGQDEHAHNSPRGLTTLQLLRYVALVYDKASPFVRDYQNVRERKEAVAEYLNLEKNELIAQAYENKNEEINKAVIRYCRLCGGHELTTLAVLSESYYATLALIQDGKVWDKDENPLVDAQKKEQLKKTLPEQLEQIVALRKKYFASDDEIAEEYFEEEEGIAEEFAFKYLPTDEKEMLQK